MRSPCGGTTAREANDRLNEYVADRRGWPAVWHDLFVGTHGGAVVLGVSSEKEQALLNNPGPLAGWELSPADPRLWWQRRTA